MLNFTKSERRALLVVVIILAVSIFIQWILPHVDKPEMYDYSLEDSLFNALSDDTAAYSYDNYGGDNHKSGKPELKEKSININTADQKTLERLPRIGPVTAGNILKYREENGPFETFEAIKNVTRIGPKTLEGIQPYIILTEDTSGTY
ncbi:MAG: hypothetical protein GF313_10125 [Caldithrix sp.]|nr:hypothetical protein [Caldithrix sp.]